MSELPQQWRSAPLAELVEVRYGKGLRATHRSGTGEVQVVGSAGVAGTHNHSLADGPVIVVGRKGNVGKAFLCEGPAWPIDTTYYFSIPSGVTPRFLWYQVGQLGLKRLDSSTAVPSLRRPDLESAEIRIPPLAEQRRIVDALDERLSELDAGVEAVARVRAKLGLYRAAVLKAAVEGELTADWRREHPEVEPASELLQRILADRRRLWEEAQLAKYEAAGKRPPKNWRARYREPVPAHTANLPRLPNGWCWATVDQCAVRLQYGTSANSPSPCSFASYLIRISLVQGTAPELVAACLNGPMGRGWVSRVASQTVGQANVSAGRLSSFAFPLAPEAEQREVVETMEDHLSLLAHVEAQIAARVETAASLRQAILREAFAGRLVPQDSNDEPAEELLRRIAAQRAGRPPRARRLGRGTRSRNAARSPAGNRR